MQDISELERRIAAAFDRIDRGLEKADRARATVVARPAETEAPETSQSAIAQMGTMLRKLEIAKAGNADWALRYTALEAQLAETTLSLTTQITKLTEDLAKASADLEAALAKPPLPSPLAQELQAVQDQLAESRRQLAAQSVEVTQLRAQRATEIEELKSIVAALTPLIEEAKPNA